MRLVTWNVNGLRARFTEVTRLVADLVPDVVCLQEIKASASQVPEPLTGLPDYWSHYHGGPGGYSGVSVHLRRSGQPARPTVEIPDFDFETRIVCARGASVDVASVYVPNGGKDFRAKIRFLEQLSAWSLENPEVILAGDLNVALTEADVHPSMRKAEAVGQRARERSILNKIIASGARDLVREAHADAVDVFTWWPPWRDEKLHNHGWRIDFVLAPRRLAERVTKVEILADFGTSDHVPVLIEFGL